MLRSLISCLFEWPLIFALVTLGCLSLSLSLDLNCDLMLLSNFFHSLKSSEQNAHSKVIDTDLDSRLTFARVRNFIKL